jgi:hypothetical protein
MKRAQKLDISVERYKADVSGEKDEGFRSGSIFSGTCRTLGTYPSAEEWILDSSQPSNIIRLVGYISGR